MVTLLSFQSTKRGKHSFELQMQDKSTYLFAAESDADMEGWVLTFKKVLASNEAVQAQQDRFIRGEEQGGWRVGVRYREGGREYWVLTFPGASTEAVQAQQTDSS